MTAVVCARATERSALAREREQPERDGGQRDRHDQRADEQRTVEQRHRPVARRAPHEVGLGRLEGERQRERDRDDQVDPEDLHRLDGQHRGAAVGREREHRDGDDQRLADARRQDERERLDEVVVDAAALLDRGAQRREVVVGEHHVRRLLGRGRAAPPHRDADVGLAQRRRVVDAVAGDGDDLAARLQRAAPAGACAPAPRARRSPSRPSSCSSMRSSSAPVTAGPSGSPIAVPIARAVRGWSPVSMLTRTPAAWQAAIASWTPGRGGSTSACRPIRRRPPSSRSIAVGAVAGGEHQHAPAERGLAVDLRGSRHPRHGSAAAPPRARP